MREVDLVAVDEAGDQGGAHALTAGVAGGGLVDPPVRQLDAADQPVLDVRELAVHLVGPGGLFILGALIELAQGVGGHLRRHLTHRVTTHAIGNDEQLFVFDEREVVLVMVPLHPDVGLRGVADPHGAWPVGIRGVFTECSRIERYSKANQRPACRPANVEEHQVVERGWLRSGAGLRPAPIAPAWYNPRQLDDLPARCRSPHHR